MVQGAGYHEESESKLYIQTEQAGGPAPVVTSAGTLVRSLDRLGAEQVTLIAPYVDELIQTVIEYFEHAGVDVIDYETLEYPDNLKVAQLVDGELLLDGRVAAIQ